ncbi:MAG TPA: hypothetical protein VE777_11800 [Gaiellales bacterium]|nr:hypothetical protein [Gaiellales bacterium]
MPLSGQYAVVDDGGRHVGRLSAEEGDVFPPTRYGTLELGYRLVAAVVSRRS